MAQGPTEETPEPPRPKARRKNGEDEALGQSLQAAIKAATDGPASDEAWDRVEELADTLQRPEEVAAAYRDALEGELSRPLRTALSQRAAQFHDEWFGDNPDAMDQMLTAILKRDPDAQWAFERLTVVLTVAERWDQLLDHYDRVLQTTAEPDRRKRLLEDATHVAKDVAGQPGRAVDYLQLQLELEPSRAKLVPIIERLLERQSRWEDLIELWQARLPEQSTTVARTTRIKIAKTFLDHLEAAAPALGELQILVEELPGQVDACELLERVLTWQTAAPPIRLAALSLLRTSYEAADRPRVLVTAIETAIGLVEPHDQLSLRREAGARLAILGDDSNSLSHYAELLRLDPTDGDARRQMRQLAKRSSLHGPYAEALTAAAPPADPGQRAALLLEAGDLYRRDLGQTDRAIDLYASVVELGDADQHVALTAAHHLNELLAASSRASERLDVLERLAELEQASAVRRAVLGEVGRLADELDDPERALRAYERRLESDEKDMTALEALVNVLAKRERWDELSNALRRRARATSVPQQRRADFARVARLQAEQLGSPTDAIETWLVVREEFGDEVETVTALDELMAGVDRWADLAEILEGAATVRRSRSATLLTRLGTIHQKHLDQPVVATRFFAQALGVEPGDPEARAGLRTLISRDDCAPQAVDALVRAYKATGDFIALLEITERRIEVCSDTREAVELLREAATYQEKYAESPTEAQASVARAFALDPEHPGIEHELRRLAELTGDWGSAALAYAGAAGTATATGRAAKLRREEGRIHEEHLDDPDAAVAAYAAAAELDPGSLQTRRAIIRASARAHTWSAAAAAAIAICRAREVVDETALTNLADAARSLGEWEQMLSATEKAIEAGNLRGPLARALLARCASWHLSERNDPDAAEAAARWAVTQDPDHRETLLILADLQRRNPGPPLAETLLRIDLLTARSLDALHEAAEVAASTGADPAWTRETVSRLYRKSSRLFARGEDVAGERQPEASVIWSLGQLVNTDVAAGDRKRAIRALTDASELPLPRERILDLRVQAARLYVDEDQPGHAIDMFRRVLEERRDDIGLVVELAALCEQEDRLVELVTVRDRELALTTDPQRRLALRLELSKLGGQLEQRGGRVQSLLSNLGEQPGHRPTIDALTDVLSEKGQFTELANVLAEQAQSLEDSDDSHGAAVLWAAVAALVEERFSDVDRAIEALRRVVALEPTDDALDSLARLHSQRGEPAAAAAVLKHRLENADPAQRVSVLLRLARAQLQAEEESNAIETLEEAFSEAPRSGEVRKLLLGLYRKHERWEALAQALAIASEHVTDTETTMVYAREAAHLFNVELGTPERSVAVLERARAIDPEDRDIRSMLAEGLIAAERLDEARELLLKLLEDFGRRRSPGRAAAHLQLAKVARAQGNVEDATEQLERASKMDASDPAIMWALAEMARQTGQLDRAERAYRALLLLVRRNPTKDFGAAAVLFELSSLASERGDQDQTDELAESGLEALIAADEQGPALQRRLRERGDFDLLKRVLDTRLGQVDTPRRRAELLGELAALLENELQDPGAALDARLSAMRSDPASPEHHQRARELAASEGRLAEYVGAVQELLDKARRTTDVYVRCELLLRLAEAVEESGDLGRAAELVDQAEALGVREIDVWRAIARIAGAAGETERQVEFLEKLTDLGETADDTRSDALYRMAEVYLANEDTLDRGIEKLSAAIDSEPRHERACRILSRATEAHPGNAELLALYDRVARRSGEPEVILEAIERRGAHPETSPEDLREGVELALQLEAFERAEALMLRAVELGSALLDGQERVGWALKGLAERCKAEGDLPGAVKWTCEAIESGDPAPYYAMAAEIAALAMADGGDANLAIKMYETMLERDASAREVWEPLAELYRQIDDLDRLHRLVDETLDSLHDPDERNALRLQLCHSLLTQKRDDDAIDVLRNVLLEAPEHDEAQRLMADLLERAGNESELADLLRTRLMNAQERHDTAAVVAAARHLGERLAKTDAAEALGVIRGALDWAPDDKELLGRALELTAEDDAATRSDLIERLIAVEDGDRAASLAADLAQTYKDVDDAEGELRALVLGYRRAPSNDMLRQRLEKAYEDRGDYRGLAQMLLAAADDEQETDARVTMLRQAAQIHRELLSDPETSADILERAHSANPDDADLALELASALASAGKFDRATTLVSALLDDVHLADDHRLQLLSTRADLRSNTGDIEGAVLDLEGALVLDTASIVPRLANALERRREAAHEGEDAEIEREATLRLVEVVLMTDERDRARQLLEDWVERERKDVDALRLLREIDTADERWEAVAKICARLVAVEAGGAQVEAALHLSHACQEMGKPEDARAGLEHARRKQPEDKEIRAELGRVYELVGAERELARLLQQEAEETEDAAERLDLLRRVAGLLVGLGDTSDALPAIKEVLELAPGDAQATVTLADAYVTMGEVDEADSALDAAIAAIKGRRSPELATLFHRKARVAGARGDTEAQLAVLQQAFAVDKNNGQVAAELADLAEAVEQWDLAIRVLRTIALIDADCPITRVQAFLRQAVIFYRRGDPKRAELWALKARHEAPDDPEVEHLLSELRGGE